jgi:hypothetical protein
MYRPTENKGNLFFNIILNIKKKIIILFLINRKSFEMVDNNFAKSLGSDNKYRVI